MRYLFISDVHGEFDKMLKALSDAKFNPETDTLVTVGDMFDRGPDSKEILEHLLELPHTIFIYGNHDLRLKELILGQDRANQCDKSNGLNETLKSFCKDAGDWRKSNSPSDIMWLIRLLKSDSRLKKTYKNLWEYFDKCVYAIEFNDLIATHAWIPVNEDFNSGVHTVSYCEYWKEAPKWLWYETSWIDSAKCIKCGAHKKIDKNLLIGHYHSWRIAQLFLGVEVVKEVNKGEITINQEEISKIRQVDNVIAIDGCVNFENGKVLVYEYNSNEKPIEYRGE